MKDRCLTSIVTLSTVLWLSYILIPQSISQLIYSKYNGHFFRSTSHIDVLKPKPDERLIIWNSNSSILNLKRNAGPIEKSCGPRPRLTEVPIFTKRNDGPGHIFSFPGEYSNYTLCIPQKNGNRNFGALLYRLWKKQVPRNAEEVITFLDKSLKRWWTKEYNSSNAYFIARNPYSRLLSEYLNHVVGQCVLETKCDHDPSDSKIKIVREALNISNASDYIPSFQEYVYFLTLLTTKGICRYNHHLCPQSVNTCLYNKNVVVLKLEEQYTWWSCFLESINVDNSMLFGWDWIPYAGKPCYYSPSPQCGDDPVDLGQGGIKVGPVHGTNASGRLNEYYTQETALIVTKIYSKDLEIFEYPTWDGLADF